jgi:hypothetical protein
VRVVDVGVRIMKSAYAEQVKSEGESKLRET